MRAASENRYKPYTLKEYKEKQNQDIKLSAGLGPNIGSDDWKLRN